MANRRLKQKLELSWIGKEHRPKLEPRILIENPEKTYHARHRVSDDDIFDNRLIYGDNLLALKSLEQEFSGKVKCIYIDPPYNTGQALEHYDDGIEHSIWLSLMIERFEILKNLLSRDGTFFCQLNDDEMAYGKVLLDEVFGRSNFINQVSVKMKQTAGASGGGEDKKLKKNIEYLLIYARDMNIFDKFNETWEEQNLFDLIYEMRDTGKSWKYTRVITDFGKKEFFSEIQDGSGQPIQIYSHSQVQMKTIPDLMKEDQIEEEECYVKYFDKIFRDTNAQSSIRTRVMEATKGAGDFFSIDYVPISGRSKGKKTTLYYKGRKCDLIAWLRNVAIRRGDRLLKLEKTGTYWEGFPLNNLTKEGGVRFPHGKKPEALLQRVFELATNPGDLILDSFLGSGTAAAVAHKMGLRWIGIELGDHCHTHCIPRLQKVINGEDSGGITKTVNWKGGGGFRYYRLGPSLIIEDQWGNPVINSEFNAAMLAEAMCKLEGFDYAPSADVYWIHGKSTETDFLYVTTQFMSKEMLAHLSDEVGLERSLLICCSAFRCDPGQFPNLTIKKIPKAVLKKCEWGHDDYSLEIKNLPKAPPESEEQTENTHVKPRRKFGKDNPAQRTLFDMGGDQ